MTRMEGEAGARATWACCLETDQSQSCVDAAHSKQGGNLSPNSLLVTRGVPCTPPSAQLKL
jgi:hypothetical protein